MMTGQAVPAHVARDMMGHKDAITFLPFSDVAPDFRYLTGNLVT
jgi:hypothetical protein